MGNKKKLDFCYVDYSKLQHIDNKLFNKNGRKYFVSISLENGYHGLIPLKSNLNHPYGIKSINGNGLDLHKTLVIHDSNLASIKMNNAFISNREYNVLYSKQGVFLPKFNKCVDDYVKALVTPESERTRIQTNLITHTTLKNYHVELRLDERIKKQQKQTNKEND